MQTHDSERGPGERRAPAPGALVEARGLSKSYGGVRALHDAAFSAPAGEVRALLGENGAGKSTFVKLLTGAVTPDTGELTIAGERLTRLTPKLARERRIAAVFQELSLIPHLTAAENIWFPYEPRTALATRSQTAMHREAKRLFKRLGFPLFDLRRAVRDLSLAERQLVEIAKAVSGDPKVLVLDESTSALAPAEARLVMDMTRRLAADGALCIYISHRLAEVRAVADRMTVFRNGEVVGNMDVEGTDDDEVIQQIIGRRLEQLYPPRSQRSRGGVRLRCRGLTAGTRLRGVDLELRAGEILGVGGLQGQGQLELFLRLFGALRGGGSIEVGGRPARIRSPRQALGAGIGFALIPEDRQNEGLLLGKSVRENLALTRLGEIARWGLIRRDRERKLIEAAVRSLGIVADSPEQAVAGLSGGNQQKVVIAKFLGAGIETLLWYDPTRGIDIGAKHEIFRLIQDQAAAGRATLFFSTDSEELIQVCDRVLVLAGGRASALLERDDLSEEALMRASMALPAGGA